LGGIELALWWVAMDRPLDPDLIRRAERRRRTLAVAAVALLAAGYAWAPSLLRPSVQRARLRTAVVDEGAVESSLTGSGVVKPAAEQVLVSPVDARVLRIVHAAGDRVAAGEPLVELDLSATRLDTEKQARAVALQENAQARTRLDLERSLADLDARREIKALQLEQLRAALQRTQSLAAEGLVAAETLQAAELAAKQAAIELQQLERESSATRARTQAELVGLALQMQSARGDLGVSSRRLEDAAFRADRDAVVTWTVAEAGAMVRQGEPVARLADLGSFRVEATASDVHARTITTGLAANVRVGDQLLPGTVVAVEPAIRNGAVSFQVALADARSPLLRANQRVDVLVVTGRKERTTRVQRGPGLNGGATQVFVVRGDDAMRTSVRTGLVGYDVVEVTEGLKPGDEVVVSDMADWFHASRLKVR
jgi:HlyD family secretion protein